jgi:hypothetical protein
MQQASYKSLLFRLISYRLSVICRNIGANSIAADCRDVEIKTARLREPFLSLRKRQSGLDRFAGGAHHSYAAHDRRQRPRRDSGLVMFGLHIGQQRRVVILA